MKTRSKWIPVAGASYLGGKTNATGVSESLVFRENFVSKHGQTRLTMFIDKKKNKLETLVFLRPVVSRPGPTNKAHSDFCVKNEIPLRAET